MMSSSPQKKWYVHLNGFAGSPLRPKNQGCHGASDEMHGTPFASHVSETGFVMSGVSPTSIRSMLSSEDQALGDGGGAVRVRLRVARQDLHGEGVLAHA